MIKVMFKYIRVPILDLGFESRSMALSRFFHLEVEHIRFCQASFLFYFPCPLTLSMLKTLTSIRIRDVCFVLLF